MPQPVRRGPVSLHVENLPRLWSEGHRTRRHGQRCHTAEPSRWRRGHKPRTCRQPMEAGKGKEMDSPQGPEVRTQLWLTS